MSARSKVAPLRGMAARRANVETGVVVVEGPSLTTAELLEATGASYRQLDHWTRNGLLYARPGTGTGKGRPRAYDLDQLPRARAIYDLAAAGIDFDAIREHLDHLLQHGGYQAGSVTVTYTPEMTP